MGLAPPPTPANKKTNTSVQYSPGIRINWKALRVEIDATVVLRKGPLELLACSPGTREHESILTVSAKPRDIYHALGLIGLEPGSPVSFDPAKEKWSPPTGEELEITARYRHHDETVVVDVRQWLRDAATDRPPTDLHWVFAGSRSLESGKFGADLDGTIACVVDFDTALIAIDTTQTSSDESLWLRAGTDAIPPIGTACTLVIGGVNAIKNNEATVVHLLVGPDGTLSHEGRQIQLADLGRLWDPDPCGGNELAVTLHPEANLPKDVLHAVVAKIIKLGIPERYVRIERPPAKPATDARSDTPKPGG